MARKHHRRRHEVVWYGFFEVAPMDPEAHPGIEGAFVNACVMGTSQLDVEVMFVGALQNAGYEVVTDEGIYPSRQMPLSDRRKVKLKALVRRARKSKSVKLSAFHCWRAED
ncbi:MAG: hypothetical protein ABJA67_00060 [Chthonomonadales bacterium]